ncbi:MAG TPA: zinc-binding dehydrogenase [Chloroflexota bacterium]|nr:zinc-binding dehydrogenase [Chloroflexota bacterium]
MKAILVHEPGGPDALRYEDAPDPRPGPAEVLVRVRAVGVNFADHLMRIGAYHGGAPPIIPGLELAGTVEAVGQDVAGLRAGDRVIAWARRTYAELAVAPAWSVLPMPPGMSFEEAAAIPVAFGTAWHALVTLAGVAAGERVLVHAAGSGVGSAALQIAKRLGAWVVATAGQDWKLERARALGADAVVNYASQNVAEEVRRATDGHGVDVALEGVGKATFAASVASLADDGRCVIYGSPSGPRVELDTRLAIMRNLTFFGMSVTTGRLFSTSVATFAQQALPWFAEGRLRPIVDQVYELRDAPRAHQRMMDRAQFGKMVLRVGG